MLYFWKYSTRRASFSVRCQRAQKPRERGPKRFGTYREASLRLFPIVSFEEGKDAGRQSSEAEFLSLHLQRDPDQLPCSHLPALEVTPRGPSQDSFASDGER